MVRIKRFMGWWWVCPKCGKKQVVLYGEREEDEKRGFIYEYKCSYCGERVRDNESMLEAWI